MSSTITIGFLDRTRVCLQAEFTPPLADDERRELLIHAALLTGRAFASLSPERQQALAGVLRQWIAERFASCSLQVVDADPMACPHRFASTFLAPVREYALATTGCDREAGGIDYFLPMAAAAYLRHVAIADRDPEELLKPALALCAAVAIHPITVANHFQMATASIPKIEPVVDRTAPADPVGHVRLAKRESRRRLLETRRSLIVSACLAALMIALGVQYLSTRGPRADATAPHVAQPKPAQKADAAPRAAPPQGTAQPVPGTQPAPEPNPVVAAPRAHTPMPLSPQSRAYLRKVRDLAENSLAQAEVMLAAADRKRMVNDDPSETLDYGARQLQSWRRQFAALVPPGTLTGPHQEIGRIMTELGHIAQTIRTQPAKPDSGAIRNRLSLMHEELARALNEAEVF